MAWTIEYVPERMIAVVTGVGEVRNEEAKAQTVAAVGLLKENEATDILIDYSEAFSEVSLPELYWLAYHASDLGVPWNVRIAVVLPRTGYRLEAYQFFELVFRNVGYNIRLFQDREEAEEWLAALGSGRRQEEDRVHA